MTRRMTVVIVVCIAILAMLPVSGLLTFLVGGVLMGREAAQSRKRLLSETDHQALVNACRELAQRRKAGYVDLDMKNLPEPIRSLQPRSVTVGQDGMVAIEMSTGWSPLGVTWYPEDFPKYRPPFKYGDRRLLDGLWYYDDGYRGNPAFDKKIDQLLRK